MSIFGVKKVYKALENNRIEKIYTTREFNNRDIIDFITLINKEEKSIDIQFVTREEIDKMTGKKFEVHEDIVGITKKKLPVMIFIIITIMLLSFISIGVAFSLSSKTETANPNIDPKPTIKPTPDINVGKIILNYSDSNGIGPGILIKNAEPVSDEVGMKMMGKGNYFDFTISGSTDHIPLDYYILIEEDKNSTLKKDQVKIYLTKINGSMEDQILLKPFKISELEDFVNESGLENQKVIYAFRLDEKYDKFIDKYRLRIWLSEDAENYYEKNYKLKVNVLGKGR